MNLKNLILIRSLLFLCVGLLASGATPYPLGWKSNPHHPKGLTQVVHNAAYEAAPLPPAASVKQMVPAAYKQFMQDCTANAGSAAFEAQWKVQHTAFAGVSRLDLYQNELKHDGFFPQDRGSYTSSILWVLLNQGVAMERCWPYVPGNLSKSVPQCAINSRGSFKAIKAYDVPNDDGGYAVKQCIANIHIPVLTGGFIYQSMFSPKRDAKTGKWYVPMPSGPPAGGHEILIISYDDNLVIAGIKGWAEIHNSWGTGWSDQGRAWLPQKYLFDPHQFEDNGAIEITK